MSDTSTKTTREGAVIEFTRTMSVLDHTGDTEVGWNPGDPESVALAEATFGDLLAKGYTAFEIGRGKDGGDRQAKTFDPTAEKVIMVPRIQGG